MNSYSVVAEDIPKPNSTPNRLRCAPISVIQAPRAYRAFLTTVQNP